MKYTVEINEKSKTVAVNLNGYKGVAKCCETDTFNLQTGIELALERARVAQKTAEEKKNKGNCPNLEGYGKIMSLVRELEKALPKGQVVIVGNGNGLTAEQKKWLHSYTDCKGKGGYTEADLDEAYRNGYADGADECECDCGNCDLWYTEDEYDKAYDKGYSNGHSDGYDEGYNDRDAEDNTDAEELAEKIRGILEEYED
jgi:flagellar biosynthesis/type III secretory pathway protein FliH